MKKIICVALILATVLTLMIPVVSTAASAGQTMWVNCADGKRLNLREEPNTNSRIITRIDCGTKVDLIRDLGDGWMFISVGKQTGYVMKKFLVETKPGKYEITERDDNFVSVTPYTVTAKALNSNSDRSVGLRVKPNKTAKMVRRLTAGDELQVIARGKVWSKVVDLKTGKTGYVANEYIRKN